jgi:transcriptional regulator with XRE-family HTH domain
MSQEPQEPLLLTPNQTVAYNMRRARLEKGWSQAEAAERLAPYLGKPWSTASYSLAECSLERPERIRVFGADELVALSQAFGLPVLWFLLPPNLGPEGAQAKLMPPDAPGHAISAGPYLEALLGGADGPRELAVRVDELRRDRPGEMKAEYFALLERVSTVYTRRAINQVVADLDERAQSLRDLAALLEESSAMTADRLDDALGRVLTEGPDDTES